MRARPVIVALLCAGALGSTCASHTRAAQTKLQERGGVGGQPSPSYRAGLVTLTGPSGAVDVWYPALVPRGRNREPASYDLREWLPSQFARRVPSGVFSHTMDAYRGVKVAAGRPFPLVLFAHGLYSFRDQSTFLTTFLASHGFVVAAPELPAHDLTAYFANQGHADSSAPPDYEVLAETEQLVEHENSVPTSVLFGALRVGELAVVGHSLGGQDAAEFATRPEVATYAMLAGAFIPPSRDLPAKRSLFMAGARDADVTAASVVANFSMAPAPRRLVVIPDAGHLAFTDMCDVAGSHGGLAALGRELGVSASSGGPFTSRALDGCGPGYLAPSSGWTIVDRSLLDDLHAAFDE